MPSKVSQGRRMGALRIGNGWIASVLVVAAAGCFGGPSPGDGSLLGASTAPIVTTETKKLVASDAADNDYFGYSVAVSGDIALVGAPTYEDLSGLTTGYAYVFERNLGGAHAWGERKKLLASDGVKGDQFGWSVAVSGDIAVVGAYWADSAGKDSGAAYVFERNLGGQDNWGERKKLLPNDLGQNDQFGFAVAASGGTIVVGSFLEDGDGFDRGAVYVFERNEGGKDNWGETKKLVASDTSDQKFFGGAVDIAGDTIIVGANGKEGSGFTAGAAYLFDRNLGGEGAWGERKKLVPSDGAPDDGFGNAVAVSGDIALASAPWVAGGLAHGNAAIFERNVTTQDAWGETSLVAASDPGDGDYFGWSASVSSNVAVFGAMFKDGDSGFDRGAAYVYERRSDGSPWTETAKLTASDGSDYDNFGNAVAVAGDTIVVGAFLEDGDGEQFSRGAAYVFGGLEPGSGSGGSSGTPSGSGNGSGSGSGGGGQGGGSANGAGPGVGGSGVSGGFTSGAGLTNGNNAPLEGSCACRTTPSTGSFGWVLAAFAAPAAWLWRARRRCRSPK